MDAKSVMSGLEGLTEYDWRMYHSDSEVRNIARDAIALLKEQDDTIKNLEQEIRDKNIRLKERAEQVDSMLKKQSEIVLCKDCKYGEKCTEPHIDYWCNIHEFYRDGDWFCADGQTR